jgi:leucyl-tRNA synthetase
MFMGPLDAAKPWQTAGVTGVRRFLDRAWRLVCSDNDDLHPLVQDIEAAGDLLRLSHRTVRQVTQDIETLRFNTAVARLMEMANALMAAPVRPRRVVETFVLLLAPFAPHLAEELWRKLGYAGTLAFHPWPDFDPALVQDERREYAVQVNGKLRHRFFAAADLEAEALIAAAQAEPQVTALLSGKTVTKAIAVRGRLVNFVLAKDATA